MKKKRFAALLLALPLTMLCGCKKVTAVQISPNWFKDTSAENLIGKEEHLEYAVEFEPNKSGTQLTVSYENGVFKTDLTTETKSGKTVYCFKSELSISGHYTLNGNDGAIFHDSVKSTVYFEDGNGAYKPIESRKEVHCTSPTTAYKTVEEAYVTYEYTYSLVYETLAKPKLTYMRSLPAEKDGGEYRLEKTLSLGNTTNFYDNEQLLFLLRGVDTSSAVSLNTINPLTNTYATVKMKEAPKSVKEASFKDKLVVNGNTVTEAIDTYTFSFGYNSATAGQAQTLAYAKCTDTHNNVYHNVLLSMSVPTLQDLGALKYTLVKADFSD